ncbi:unnamed protein product [Vitrella brassicaformis CCMP3155]|uniref:Uncharacterized protein n=1 Tax=Vitrella brassicaformis (strain CCMP3155) TaxID=1169540 RepID=A0A0G4FNQ5_VITBC|nr:unnamed protein product [Vitrella brassicaformis CCMP3155]|eukprot:CEM15812.1 unnamed protein product [Vitrella brassicaformis CCMP3155]
MRCFALKGLHGRRLCLREVVRQACVEELDKWQLSTEGVPLLCKPFDWQQLGGVEGLATGGERYVRLLEAGMYLGKYRKFVGRRRPQRAIANILPSAGQGR